MSFLRKQESRLLRPPKSPSAGFGSASAGLSRQGRGDLLHSAKMFPFRKSLQKIDWATEKGHNLTVSTQPGPYQI